MNYDDRRTLSGKYFRHKYGKQNEQFHGFDDIGRGFYNVFDSTCVVPGPMLNVNNWRTGVIIFAGAKGCAKDHGYGKEGTEDEVNILEVWIRKYGSRTAGKPRYVGQCQLGLNEEECFDEYVFVAGTYLDDRYSKRWTEEGGTWTASGGERWSLITRSERRNEHWLEKAASEEVCK